jgi:hypothetical protein
MSSGREPERESMLRWNHKSWPLTPQKTNPRQTIPPAPAESYEPDSASRFGNTPARESDESSLEEIMVADRRHPLFGRKFKVIRRLGHAGKLSGFL